MGVVVIVVVGVDVVVLVAVVVAVEVAVVRTHPVNDPARNALVMTFRLLTTSPQSPCTLRKPPRVHPTELATMGDSSNASSSRLLPLPTPCS